MTRSILSSRAKLADIFLLYFQISIEKMVKIRVVLRLLLIFEEFYLCVSVCSSIFTTKSINDLCAMFLLSIFCFCLKSEVVTVELIQQNLTYVLQEENTRDRIRRRVFCF